MKPSRSSKLFLDRCFHARRESQASPIFMCKHDSICALESVVERKETMILSLQEKLLVFSDALEKEQALSKKVGSLAQY